MSTITETKTAGMIRIDHDTWTAAVGWAATAIPNRPLHPVVACIRLQWLAGNLEVSGFDYGRSARSVIPAIGEFPEEEILIPGGLLTQLTAKLPKGPVTLTATGSGQAVELACAPVTYNLLTVTDSEYPLLPVVPEPAGTVDGGLFTTALRAVVAAASNDITLPVLTAVHVTFGPDVLSLRATDRYRMAAVDVPWTRDPAVTSDPSPALIPGDACKVIVKDRPAGPVTLHYGSTEGRGIAGYTTAGGVSLTTRLIDGEAPRYESRFADARDKAAGSVVIPAGPVIEAVARVAVILERNQPVRLTFTPGLLTVHTAAGANGGATETMTVDTDDLLDPDGGRFGGELTIPFNPVYLTDGIAGAATETVTIKVADGPTKPVLFTADPGEGLTYEYLVVPLRTPGETA